MLWYQTPKILTSTNVSLIDNLRDLDDNFVKHR